MGTETDPVESFDVLIVGAGLSGIGAGCHLRRERPGATFAILEGRSAIGGTWDLFRYPGIRSDSDMHTFGYEFAPWTDPRAIADGPSILSYVRETADRYRVTEQVRFGHRVLSADWSGADQRWTLEVARDGGETVRMRARFVLGCAGYYDYEGGFAPDFPGAEDFGGEIVHPQKWPEGLDHAGRRVVVIGSGATAITLVPALAERAAHVTMLQRSPTYVLSLPGRDDLAALAGRWLPESLAYRLVRTKNVLTQQLFYSFCRRFPAQARALLRARTAAQLPDDVDVDTHFRPAYDPWDQRVCVSPSGDLFKALRARSASIVTDRIDRFTPTGVRLADGSELDADIIITATGLRVRMMGGIALSIDGEPVDVPSRLTYKGAMLSGVPNFAFVVGYTNASWTLKADLVCGFVCRVLAYMDEHGYTECRPPLDPPGIEREPVIDLKSGYIERALGEMPAQGSTRPWRLRQNYALDRYDFTRRPLADGVLRFSRATPAAPVPAGLSAAGR